MRTLRTAFRIVLGLPFGLALLCVAIGAGAQASPPPPAPVPAQMLDTMLVGPQSAAVTFCHVEHGHVYARTFVDATQLQQPRLAEILVHESVHRADMAADSTLCGEQPRDVLRTEVHAYCVSDAVAVALGAIPWATYAATLNTLVQQFNATDVPYQDVVSSWYSACGARFGMPNVPTTARDSTTPRR